MKRKFIIAIITALSLCCIIPAKSVAYSIQQLGTLAHSEPAMLGGKQRVIIHNNFIYMISDWGSDYKGLYRFDMNGDITAHDWECIGFEDEAPKGLAFKDNKMIVATKSNLYGFDIDTRTILFTFDKDQLAEMGLDTEFSRFRDIAQDKNNPETLYVSLTDIDGYAHCLKTTTFGADWILQRHSRYPIPLTINNNDSSFLVFYGQQAVKDNDSPALGYSDDGGDTFNYVYIPQPFHSKYMYHLAILDDNRWIASACDYLYVISNNGEDFRQIDHGETPSINHNADYYYCYEDYTDKSCTEKALFATRTVIQDHRKGQFVMITNWDETPKIQVLAEMLNTFAWQTIKYADNQFIMLTTKGTFLLEISDDEICGISEITTETPETSTLFDLQGRKLESTPSQGLYIQNGRKVMK